MSASRRALAPHSSLPSSLDPRRRGAWFGMGLAGPCATRVRRTKTAVRWTAVPPNGWAMDGSPRTCGAGRIARPSKAADEPTGMYARCVPTSPSRTTWRQRKGSKYGRARTCAGLGTSDTRVAPRGRGATVFNVERRARRARARKAQAEAGGSARMRAFNRLLWRAALFLWMMPLSAIRSTTGIAA